MNFCPECNFLLYKNLKSSKVDVDETKDTSGQDSDSKETYENILSPDMSKCSLVEYCKNCGYENKVVENNVSVYKRNYQNNFIVDRLLKNKYTIYDSTLPRLDIKCKNKHCITHNSSKELSRSNAIIINNIPEQLTNQEIENILEQYTFGTISKISSEDKDYIKTINGYNMFYKRIKLCQLIVYFENSKKKQRKKKTSSKKKSSDDTSSISSEESKSSKGSKKSKTTEGDSEILNNFKNYIEDYTLEIKSSNSDDTVSVKQFRTEEFKLPNNEVIFIKYDPANMKYLYMCINCGDSW